MRAIAARARVATGTLFLYARDKRELLFLVFQDEAQRIFAESDAALRDDTGLVDALMGLFGGFLDFYARNPELSAALLREFFFRPYEPERLGALTREYGVRVAARVERARQSRRSARRPARRDDREPALRPLRLLGPGLARLAAGHARRGRTPAAGRPAAPDRRLAPHSATENAMTNYDDALSLREARGRYFEDNAFGEDGGYAAKWVKLQLGPLPFAFPNSAARVRAVRYHDLHHVVTGYGTDLVGEAEIGAWEIASGCAGFVAAWVLNLYALALGFLAGNPGAVWRAFLRGRRTRNLYRDDFSEALLDARLGAVRARLGLETETPVATIADRVTFALWCALASALFLATLALLGSPLWLGIRALV